MQQAFACLVEVVLMSTLILCFGAKIRRISILMLTPVFLHKMGYGVYTSHGHIFLMTIHSNHYPRFTGFMYYKWNFKQDEHFSLKFWVLFAKILNEIGVKVSILL